MAYMNFNGRAKAQELIIKHQDATIDRLTKELAAREVMIAKLVGGKQTYVNIAEIMKVLNEKISDKSVDNQ
ncbi:MAG: hypothetical protein EOM41_08525 [Bacilli bacterium]|nr:hypothetical protein [Bacilli bacterium]